MEQIIYVVMFDIYGKQIKTNSEGKERGEFQRTNWIWREIRSNALNKSVEWLKHYNGWIWTTKEKSSLVTTVKH